MHELTKSHRGRIAIRNFKTIADALTLRGFYRLNGTSGQTLEQALRSLSPEIYGKMNDSRRTELKGLEYVMDRLPRGVEACSRIVLTTEDGLDGTSFEKIIPLKRRRISYRMSEHEICFIITRGLSEIYDILTHLTFLNIEAKKIYGQMNIRDGEVSPEWQKLENSVHHSDLLESDTLDKALWNLSILLGLTYQETRATYLYFEENRQQTNSNNSLFEIIYALGQRIDNEKHGKQEGRVYFTPSLREMIGNQQYAEKWSLAIREKLEELNLNGRPLHIISANLHSFLNILYAYGALTANTRRRFGKDLYALFEAHRNNSEEVAKFAESHGCWPLIDRSGAQISCQIFDTARLAEITLHPALNIDRNIPEAQAPVLLVMDYAFGSQAFEILDELLELLCTGEKGRCFDIRSISIMGKAGILPGKKGDIMLASAHVIEGSAHNYIVKNDLIPQDFDQGPEVFVGPMVTVLGTSLQNRDVLERFQTTSWRAVGIEMEGGHYHRAISAAILRGYIHPEIKVRYAYYASDNPLISGQTLASGGMGREGIKPTYMITKVIIEKILALPPCNSDDVQPHHHCDGCCSGIA